MPIPIDPPSARIRSKQRAASSNPIFKPARRQQGAFVMSGGVQRRNRSPSTSLIHWWISAYLRIAAAVAIASMAAACSLFPQQAAAPIVDHSNPEPEVDSQAADAEEPSSTVIAPPEPQESKPHPVKPKRRVVKPKPREPAPKPPVEEEPPPPPPPAIISTHIIQQEQVHGLLDSEVQRPDGKVVGRAVDMYVDPAAKPKIMIVNLSGFMGIGDRKVTFPWSAFRFSPASKKAPVTFTAPAPVPPGSKAKPEAPPKPGSPNDIGPNVAQMVDSNVLQRSGARIGRVVDVLIDSQAQPQALVIDLSDSLNGDKRHVAANWADLHVVSRNKTLQLQMDFTDAQLKASPTYAPDQPIKIVSPVVPAPASAPAAASAPASAPAEASGARPTK